MTNSSFYVVWKRPINVYTLRYLQVSVSDYPVRSPSVKATVVISRQISAGRSVSALMGWRGGLLTFRDTKY